MDIINSDPSSLYSRKKQSTDKKYNEEVFWITDIHRRMKSNKKLQDACHSLSSQSQFNKSSPSSNSIPNTLLLNKPLDFSSSSLCLPPLPKQIESNETCDSTSNESKKNMGKMINAIPTDNLYRCADRFIIIYERDQSDNDCLEFSDDIILSECIRRDSSNGQIVFIDPDPRKLYLKGDKEIDYQAKGTDVHSLAWWGLKNSFELKSQGGSAGVGRSEENNYQAISSSISCRHREDQTDMSARSGQYIHQTTSNARRYTSDNNSYSSYTNNSASCGGIVFSTQKQNRRQYKNGESTQYVGSVERNQGYLNTRQRSRSRDRYTQSRSYRNESNDFDRNRLSEYYNSGRNYGNKYNHYESNRSRDSYVAGRNDNNGNVNGSSYKCYVSQKDSR